MQIANSFDRETVKKILRGAMYAMAVPAVLGLLEYVGKLEISNPVMAMLVAYVVPIFINAVKEYRAGK